ncbi:MAG: SusC/RagA family TonB-linked outer membrane protein [Gemmatimonadaceae bacterium]|nr:SusC/RagA family TonB-linked outer membrane protein [Gemmatimonadaceae bacterium]
MGLIRRGATALALLALAAGELIAQRRISGKVTEEGSGSPLSNVSVQLVGTTTGAYTNEQGTFSLLVPNGAVSLRVRRIGYTLKTVLVPAGGASVDVTLKKDVLQLEGIVVTGQQGTLERKNAATAVVSVGGEALAAVPSNSLDQALQGKVVGARINLNSGAPGGGGQIQIRGVTSILGNGQPLFVIDGVIMSNTSISSGANSITGAGNGIATNQDNPTNRLADMNPSEIEDIQVLKGAAAASLYGSRATNGVVLITTKRGKAGSPRWAFTQRVGQSSLLRGPGQRRFLDTASALSAAVAFGGPNGQAIFRQIYAANGNSIPYNNFSDQLFGEKGFGYNSALSVSGGTADGGTRYLASVSRQLEGGIAINTNALRDNARINIDHNVSSRVSAKLDLGITRNNANRAISNNDNSNTSPGYNFGYTPSFFNQNTPDANGNFPVNPYAGGGGVTSSNPFATFKFIKNTEDVLRFIGSGSLAFQALQTASNRLRFEYLAGIDQFNQDNQIYSPNFLQYEGNDGLLGTAVQSNGLSRQLNQRLSVSYDFTPSDLPFSLSTVAGITEEQQKLNQYRVQARGLIPGVANVNQGTQATIQTKSKEIDQAWYVQQSILAFDERLYLAGSIRGDRSSDNGDFQKFYTYPAVQGSYRFVSILPHLDEFKVRASWGETGNRPTYGARFITLQGTGLIGGVNAIGVNGILGNPLIFPERKQEVEYGFDARGFNGRIGIEATYFDAKIKDQFLQRPLAASTGLTNEFFNGGLLRNKGTEVAVTVEPIRAKGFNWVSRTSFQRVRNVVETLPIAPFNPPSTGFGAAFGRVRIAQGVSTTAIWGNKPLFFPRTGLPDSVVTRDTIVGDGTPDHEMFFTNTFTVGRFSLGVQVDWRKGGDLSNLSNNLFDEGENARDYDEPSPCRNGSSTMIICRKSNGTNLISYVDTSATAVLGAYRYDLWNGGRNATSYVQDGSFVKLREISLSFAVPAKFTQRYLGQRFSDVRLNVTGRNLRTWTKYWGADPEVNNFGSNNVGRFVDLAPFPPTKNFSFGIDFGF